MRLYCFCFLCLTAILTVRAQASPPAASPSIVSYDQIISDGNARFKAGDYAGAHDDAMKALAMDGNRFEGYALESLACFKEGKREQAKTFMDIALAKVSSEKRPQLEALAATIEANDNRGPIAATPPAAASTPSLDVPSDIGQLKGNDRLEYETLLSMLSDADKAADLGERHRILDDFMDKSGKFLAGHPDLVHLWVARAAVALELNHVHDGWAAGQKLKALGYENSNDPRIEKVIVELNQKGWFTAADPYQGPAEGQPWKVSDINLSMIWVSPGTFTMGSPFSEKGRQDDELSHTVTLTKGFWLGELPVTVSQWQSVMQNNPSVSDQEYDSNNPNNPVNGVSWTDAMEYCKRLNAKAESEGLLPDGYEYTLPTEAEWEYACRAGTSGPFAGNGKLGDMGWYWRNSHSVFAFYFLFVPFIDILDCFAGDRNVYPRIQAVGLKQANAWGFYDMHGDVCEWCFDWYGPYSTDATDPAGPSTGSSRIDRGGNYNFPPKYCRSAKRFSDSPDSRSSNIGFRLAIAPIVHNQ